MDGLVKKLNDDTQEDTVRTKWHLEEYDSCRSEWDTCLWENQSKVHLLSISHNQYKRFFLCWCTYIEQIMCIDMYL